VQPLSRWKRRLYLYGLGALFFVVVPLVIFYAAGYRYRSGLGFVQTGGVFVAVATSCAAVSLDGKYIGTSGILKHDFYIDNLSPGAYKILVAREGDHPWSHTLVVESNLVSGAASLLIPEKLNITRLLTSTATTSAAEKSFRIITIAERAAYLKAFTAHASTTAEGAVAEDGGEGLFVEDGNVFVRWLRQGVHTPDNFCGRPSYCSSEIPIERGPETATRAVFYAGAVVYRTKERGVFIAEADVRPTPVSLPLYPKAGADFVVVGGALIIKDGDALYEMSGL
jgi:hypothetical protein